MALAALVLAGVATGCSDDRVTKPGPVRRVLIVTMPGVTWGDVSAEATPNLQALVGRSAIGDVSTRIGSFRQSTTAAYLTLGAGTRSVVPDVDTGVALNPGEVHGGVPASELVRRRTGRPVDGIAYIPVGATMEANADSPFDSDPGILGQALADAGIRRAVVANADAAEGFVSDAPPPEGAYKRSAATALMDGEGMVPEGNVGRDLLRLDPAAPFGRRLEQAAVVRTFEDAWSQPGRSVVLVEASDLSRAAAYTSRASASQQAALRAEALADSDELLGKLLDDVDPQTDAVLVLAPTAPGGLGITVLRAPDVDGGMVRSASTRRKGYVYLADVAPTVLELLGESAPDGIEGTPMDAVPARGDRVAHLERQAEAAQVRADRLPLVVTLIILALLVLVIAVLLGDRLPARLRPALRPLAFSALGLVPGTFLAALVPATQRSALAYAAAVLAVAAAVGAASTLVERRWPGVGGLVAVGSVLLLVVVDLLAGAPLQVNSIFGYSMAVAGRFTGLGNLAFALFASAGVCFAVLAHDRFGRQPWIGASLVAVVLFEGLPMLGADVGGVLSVVPAFALTYLILRGRSIGWREVLACGLAGVVVVALLGLLDSSQAASSQTHLARIGQHLAAGRIGSVGTILWRRAHASFGGSAVLVWLLCLSLVGAALLQAGAVARKMVGPDAPRRSRSPETVALAVGLGALAAVGLVVNDSSIAVPATMLIVIVPVLILRRTSPDRARPPSPEASRDRRPGARRRAGGSPPPGAHHPRRLRPARPHPGELPRGEAGHCLRRPHRGRGDRGRRRPDDHRAARRLRWCDGPLPARRAGHGRGVRCARLHRRRPRRQRREGPEGARPGCAPGSRHDGLHQARRGRVGGPRRGRGRTGRVRGAHHRGRRADRTGGQPREPVRPGAGAHPQGRPARLDPPRAAGRDQRHRLGPRGRHRRRRGPAAFGPCRALDAR
ncbi:hypothetical protein ACE2AJ_01575 [Aquihabitans daechungensis]|uniref:hypothetical protein n=1 Tax=Aquihabitans daechungensis TaxID=1052257 RepID=UPI003BA07FAA